MPDNSSENSLYQYREINFDFYKVGGIKKSESLTTFIEAFLNDHSNVKTRNYPYKGDFVRIQNYACDTTSEIGCYGVFVRVKTGSKQHTAREDTEDIRDLELAEGEHLAHYSTFYYVREYQVLVLQRNQNVAKHGLLSEYISKKTGKDVTFSPLVDTDTWQKLMDLGFVDEVNVKMAVPDNLSVLDPEGKSTLAKMFGIVWDLAGAQISISIKPKRTRKVDPTLRKSAVVGFARKINEHYRTYTRKARFRGRLSTGGDTKYVDLFEESLTTTAQLRFAGENPSYKDYFPLLKQAYNIKLPDIIKQFKLKQEEEE